MKILVFSDSHLSEKFDEKKYNYLTRIIKNCDQVIINGDFWEGHTITFSQFISSPWKSLFPLLKKKHTVYIYGNHDDIKKCDESVKLFSEKQGSKYSFISGKTNFIVQHGQQWVTIGDDENIKLWLMKIANIVQSTILQLGLAPILFKRYNDVIKRRIKNVLSPNAVMICGHTHCAEIDLKNQFIDTGVNHFGLGQAVYIENGNITVVNERY